ncbi:MAG: hypothetical protein PHY48_07060 [Candidatus Cloacimonetes bacterium]|nr:hypothetical protein [Candidatus Cloacimonadota bacterium]
MRNFLFTIWILAMFASLASIEIVDNNAKPIELGYDNLLQEELTSFVTTRNKNGKDITETWQGIALLPWLNKLGLSKWHSMKCYSLDAYEIQLHRIELDTIPAFIAMANDEEHLVESDIRLIFPSLRESMWVRGLSTICLLPFEAIPHPRQVFTWEESKGDMQWDGNRLNIENLMEQGFCQKKGRLVFVDKLMQPLALEYPVHLDKAFITTNQAGDINLEGLTLHGTLALDTIVYMQCGPYAYIAKSYIPLLSQIATALQWDWENLSTYEVTGTKHKTHPPLPKAKDSTTKWIELN